MINSIVEKTSQEQINTLMDEIKEIQRKQTELDEKLTEKKNKLYELVGLNEMTASEKITTNRWQVSFIVKEDYLKFDSKKFQKEQPKLYEEYKTQACNGSKYVDLSKSKEI